MTYEALAIIWHLPFLQANLCKPLAVAIANGCAGLPGRLSPLAAATCGAGSHSLLAAGAGSHSLLAARLLGNDPLSDGEAGCPEGCTRPAGSSAGKIGCRVAKAGIQRCLLRIRQGLEGGRPRRSCPLDLLQRQDGNRHQLLPPLACPHSTLMLFRWGFFPLVGPDKLPGGLQ